MKKMLLVAAFGSALLATGVSACMADNALPRHQLRYDYTVQRGDTLWGIASKAVSDDMDIREYIHKLKEINGINNESIRPGQIITLYKH